MISLQISRKLAKNHSSNEEAVQVIGSYIVVRENHK